MDRYKIIIGKSALKQLENVPTRDKRRIVVQIDALANNPRPAGVKKLKAVSGELYRIRVGNYRVVYAVEDKVKIVDIRQIGNCKDIYE